MNQPASEQEKSFWGLARNTRAAVADRLFASAIGEEHPGLALARAVDESGHGLAEWLDALAVLQDWIESHPRPAPWGLRIGYVGCSSDYARAKVGSLPLAEVVRDFLESYGFEGGSP